MISTQQAAEEQWAERNKLTVDEARKQMHTMRKNKNSQNVEVLHKHTFAANTLAMVSYTQAATAQLQERDLILFVVYDHRVNSNIERISKFLFQDLLAEEKNIFIDLV
jgi:enterochelin esterase-like enzyme